MYSSASSRVQMNRMQRALAAWTDRQRESYDYLNPSLSRVERRGDLDLLPHPDTSEWDEKEIVWNSLEIGSDNLPSSPTTRSEESSQSTSQNFTLGSQSNYRTHALHKRILPDSPTSWKDKTSRLSTIKWCNDNRKAIEKLHSSETKTEVFTHQCSGCDKWFKNCMFSKTRHQIKFCHWCQPASDTMKTKDDFTIHHHIHCNRLREKICDTFKMDLKYIPRHAFSQLIAPRQDGGAVFRKRRVELEGLPDSEGKVRKRVLTEKARENMKV